MTTKVEIMDIVIVMVVMMIKRGVMISMDIATVINLKT
jgi:hypothetical protein